LPSNKNRSSTVHSLIHAFGLSKRVKVLRPVRASPKDIAVYHTREYLDAVLSPHPSPSPDLGEAFGLDSDCPPFPLLHAYVSLVAGSALTAAQALITKTADITICWDGGRHHAQKNEAAGYCYVADCVLALMALKRAPPRNPGGHKPRTMYIDLDLHFSDAVSHAFASSASSRVPQILVSSHARFHAPQLTAADAQHPPRLSGLLPTLSARLPPNPVLPYLLPIHSLAPPTPRRLIRYLHAPFPPPHAPQRHLLALIHRPPMRRRRSRGRSLRHSKLEFRRPE
ncbi:hypothetical protein C0993_000274, partial [Termitomyces sp. T159_Od127]